MKKTLRAGTKVLIEWEDIQDFSNDDWNDDIDADTASIVSVGWVAKDYKGGRVVHIAKDYSPDDGKYRSVIAFPAGCIVSIRELAIGRELWDVSTKKGES